MANQYVNKVIYGGNTLIDLTSDTATADKVLYGYDFHLKSGEPTTGSCTYDADTSDATAGASEILSTKTAYVNGVKITGEMPNRGAVTGTISTVAGQYTIPAGYHDGSGYAEISSTEQAKIITGNIKSGVVILGVTGSYAGEPVSVQSDRTATPTTSEQTILPLSGYDYMSQVVVHAIPYTETDNAAGGKTVSIAGS